MKGYTIIILVALTSLVAVSYSAQSESLKPVLIASGQSVYKQPILIASGQSVAVAGAASTESPARIFALEVLSIVKTIPRKQLQHLVQAYLLNDEEFQGLIRDINSLSAYRLRQLLLRQPEIHKLLIWLNQQLILGGSSIKIFDDLELEIKIFNKYPHWSQSVNGINGFLNDFHYLYPVEAIRSQLEQSAQRNPIFAELWSRLIALKSVYERVIATTQAKTFVNQLWNRGVDVSYVDSLIRYQFGWSNATTSNYDYGQSSYDYSQY